MRHEDGATAVTALVMWCAAAAAGLIVVSAIGDLALAAARAQTAADTAALAAAGATVLGPSPAEPRQAAEAAARLHGAELAACCGLTGVVPPSVRVVVRVRPRSVLARMVRPAVTARASASLRPPPEGGKSSGSAAILPIS